MRRIWLVLIGALFAIPYAAKAQFGNESPIPYFRYSVTAGGGANLLYGDLDQRQVGASVYLRGNYFLTHGISIGLELQEGLLRGRDRSPVGSTPGDTLIRNTDNLYHAATLGFRFQPIKFLQDDHLRRIEYRESFAKRTLNSVYIGAGFGVLHSLQWNKRRLYSADEQPFPEHQGRNYGFSYIVSTDVGFEIPLHSLKPNLLDSYVWNLVINGQLNFSLDDELDGYSGVYEENQHKDAYGLLSIGVNLRF